MTRRRLLPKLLLTLTAVIVGVGTWQLLFQLPEQERQKQAKHNLLEVRKAVERFLLRDRLYSYPPSIGALQESGELPQGLVNPYTRRPLRLLPPEAGPSAGDICYIPEFDAELSSHTPVAVQYALLTYRPRPGPRFVPAWYSAGLEQVDSRWVLLAYNGWANDQVASRRVSRVRHFQQQQAKPEEHTSH